MKSWRTTLFGTGGILTIIATGLSEWASGGISAVHWGVLIAALMPCISALFARDNKVTSEQAGAK